jgi:hypothetical protein
MTTTFSAAEKRMEREISHLQRKISRLRAQLDLARKKRSLAALVGVPDSVEFYDPDEATGTQRPVGTLVKLHRTHGTVLVDSRQWSVPIQRMYRRLIV